MVAAVIVQWCKFWSPIRGTEEAEGMQKHCPDWGIEYCSRAQLLCGDLWPTIAHPFCNHDNASAPLCLIWVNFDNQPPLQPLCDCFEHVQNLMMTMVSMVMSEHSVNYLWITMATILPPSSLQPWQGGRFKNTYELLNPRALKISMLYKNRIFQCMGKIFCVEL